MEPDNNIQEMNLPYNRTVRKAYERVDRGNKRYNVTLECQDCRRNLTENITYEPVDTKVNLNLTKLEGAILAFAQKAVLNVTGRASAPMGVASLDKRALASDSPGPQRIEVASRVREV